MAKLMSTLFIFVSLGSRSKAVDFSQIICRWQRFHRKRQDLSGLEEQATYRKEEKEEKAYVKSMR